MKMLDAVQGTPWRFYLSPPEAWEAMLEACRAATRTIVCEQFIFEPDEVGERFAKIFIEKAAAGVQVRLLCDGIGSYSFIDSTLLQRLRGAGVNVLFYNRLRFRKIHKLVQHFLRNHRKLLVVDDHIGCTGGLGIDARMSSWRDTLVRIEGAFALEMSGSFETMWRVASHQKPARIQTERVSNGAFQVLNNAPRLRHRHIYHALLQSVARAQKRIYLSTAYFVPSIRLAHALRKAAKRGVDVRILLPASSDVHLADVAARSYIAHFLKAGVQIYPYTDRMFHVKTAIIDDSFASIGSANLDNLSLLLNYEMNVCSTDPGFVAELARHFAQDIQHTSPVTLSQWRNRPFLEKCEEMLITPLRGIL